MFRYFILTFLAALALATLETTPTQSEKGTTRSTGTKARSGYIVASS